MKENFGAFYDQLMECEGGFVNQPNDPGGMTNLGVTKRAWESWVGHSVDEATMRALTPAIVRPFYKQNYWNAVNADLLPSGLDIIVADMAVNAGVRVAATLLQGAVNANRDGVIGPQTIFASEIWEPGHLIDTYSLARVQFYSQLRHFPTFGAGWVRRTMEFRHLALDIITKK